MVANIGLSAVATGTADIITATYSPAITLTDRRIVFLTGCLANVTTTPTFNPNALGAQVIKGKGGVALKAGEILGDCILIYHTTGTYWELLNSSGFLTSANIVETITNGVTDKAPSENAVFDALALKIDTSTKFGYAQNFNSGSVSVSTLRNTTYYFGSIEINALTTTNGIRRVYIPKGGTIKRVSCYIHNQGVLGTGETSTMNLRLNDTTDTVISAAITTNAVTQVFSNLAMNISVADMDFIEIKWPTPNWVTQPTLLNIAWTVYVETN